MFCRTLRRLTVLVAVSVLAFSSIHAGAQQDDSRRGRKFKVPPPSSRIEVTVVRSADRKPIESAAVIFHPMEGERDKGSMELKTNQDGKAVIDVIPIGDTVRLQIIARGFQTYGQDYKIDKPEMAVEIKLKRPGEQYSIYKEKGETAKSGQNPGADKSAKPSKDGSTAEPPADAKSSGSSDQPDSQAKPNQSQPQTN
jgi:hypothetical protein